MASSEQVSINMPNTFDLDSEVEGLQSQIGRLKQVPRQLYLPCGAWSMHAFQLVLT